MLPEFVLIPQPLESCAVCLFSSISLLQCNHDKDFSVPAYYLKTCKRGMWFVAIK